MDLDQHTTALSEPSCLAIIVYPQLVSSDSKQAAVIIFSWETGDQTAGWQRLWPERCKSISLSMRETGRSARSSCLSSDWVLKTAAHLHLGQMMGQQKQFQHARKSTVPLPTGTPHQARDSREIRSSLRQEGDVNERMCFD
jgi:hypothetical protein